MSRNTILLMILMILFCVSTAFVINPEGGEFNNLIKSTIQSFEKDPKGNIKSVARLAQTVRVLKREKEIGNLCLSAKQYCQTNSCSIAEFSYVATIITNADCGAQSKIDDQTLSMMTQTLSSTSELRDFYHSFITLKSHNADMNIHCKRLKEWTPSIGLPRFNTKVETLDLGAALIVHELSGLCKDSALTTQLLNSFTKRLSRIDSEHSVILNKKHPLRYTAFYLNEVLSAKIDGRKLDGPKDQDLTGLLNSLIEYANSPNVGDIFYIIKASESAQKIGISIPTVTESQIKESPQGYLLKWVFNDIFGNSIGGTKTVSVKIDGESKGDSSNNQFSLQKTKSTQDVEFIQKFSHGILYFSKFRVYLTSPVTIKDITIGLAKGSERIKEFNYKEGDTITCNQDNKIHLHFKLGQTADIEYASVYLKHSESSEFDRISSGVPLSYDENQQRYIGVLDLGDTDIIHAISGKYRLVVFLADRTLNENVQKTIAQVSLKFNKDSTLPQILDNSYPPKEEMLPVFYPPRPWSFLMNVITTVILLFGVLTILKNIISTHWNIHYLPKTGSQKSLFTYGFWIIFAALYMLLVIFWVNERFMDIVAILFGLLGLALLFGNWALSNLIHVHHNQHSDDKKDK